MEAVALAMEEIEAVKKIMQEEIAYLETSLKARRDYNSDRQRVRRERLKSANVKLQSCDSHATDGIVPGQRQKTANGGGQNSVLPFPPLSSPPVPPSQTLPPLSPTPTPPITIQSGRASAWKLGRAVPEEWLVEMAKKMGWSKRQIADEAERFVDYALAHRKTYADWRAAWRNWCRSPFQKTVAAAEKEGAWQRIQTGD